MPFIIRKIEPRYIGRGHVPQDTTCAEVWPVGAELGAITNGVLACTLKQLASLLTNAEDIFSGLTSQLTYIADRSGTLRRRIDQLDDRLATIDPKKIPVRKYFLLCCFYFLLFYLFFFFRLLNIVMKGVRQE